MEYQHATDPDMANDVANNKQTPLTDMKKDLMYISLRQNEDSKYDVKPPSRPIIKEKFIDSSSERLTLITVCAIGIFIIMLRSS
jgi:hypothetical protein